MAEGGKEPEDEVDDGNGNVNLGPTEDK